MQNTQINRTGTHSYVNVWPIEGELAAGRAGGVQDPRSYYTILANCIKGQKQTEKQRISVSCSLLNKVCTCVFFFEILF